MVAGIPTPTFVGALVLAYIRGAYHATECQAIRANFGKSGLIAASKNILLRVG